MNILIVNDSKLIRDRIVDLLEENKKIDQMYQAENLEETQKQLIAYSPELVIIDINFSDGSGIDTLNVINKKIPKSKIIVLFTDPCPQYLKKFIELGADYLFNESCEFAMINDVVSNLKLNN